MSNLVTYALGGLAALLAFNTVNPSASHGDVAMANEVHLLVQQAPNASSVVVNRSSKGDRIVAAKTASRANETATIPAVTLPADKPQTARKIPVGCDTVFSPLSVSSRLNVVGRCVS